ncbi:MAG: hypothetical protein ACE5J5_05280 [Candidatus Hydrothermarchaeales archaeon]
MDRVIEMELHKEEFLKENLGKMSIHEIAKRLNRPKSGVHYRIKYRGR